MNSKLRNALFGIAALAASNTYAQVILNPEDGPATQAAPVNATAPVVEATSNTINADKTTLEQAQDRAISEQITKTKAKKVKAPKVKKVKVPKVDADGNTITSNIKPYLILEQDATFGSYSTGSQTDIGTDVVDFASKGSQLNLNTELELGLDSKKQKQFLRVDAKIQPTSLTNYLADQENGSTKGSITDLAFSLGYGKVIKAKNLAHLVSLAGGFKMFGRNADIKYDIIDITKSDSGKGYEFTVEYTLNNALELEAKIGKVFGTSDIAPYGITNDFKRENFSLTAKVYVPALQFEASLENIGEMVTDSTGSEYETDYTRFSLEAKKQLKGKIGSDISPLIGYEMMLSGVSNTSALHEHTIYGGATINFSHIFGNGKKKEISARTGPRSGGTVRDSTPAAPTPEAKTQ